MWCFNNCRRVLFKQEFHIKPDIRQNVAKPTLSPTMLEINTTAEILQKNRPTIVRL
jgi:hypothetical protein